MPPSQQKDPDITRLGQELTRDIRKLASSSEARLDALESRVTAIEGYIAVDLIAYLEGFASFAGYGPAPPPPPWA